MNKKDILWRNILNEEKIRLSTLPAEKLIALKPFSTHTVQSIGVTIEYGLWHIVDSEKIGCGTREEASTLLARLIGNLKFADLNA